MIKRCYRRLADVNSYVRVCRKSIVLSEIVLSCAGTLHHFKTPCKAHLKTLLYFIWYSHIISQTIRTKGNVAMYQDSSLVSVVNKSRYRDTLRKYTIGNVRHIAHLFLFGAVTRKQHTVNSTDM